MPPAEDTGKWVDHALSSLGFLLRYFASGFVAVLVAATIWERNPLGNIEQWSAAKTWLAFISAGVIGVLTYCIHKNVHHPVHFCIAIWIVGTEEPSGKIKKWLVGHQTYPLDKARWERRYHDVTPQQAAQRALDAWAATLHFLYCSAYSAIFIPLGLIIAGETLKSKWWIALVSGFIVFISTFLSDVRATYYERRVTDDKDIP